MSPDFYRLLTVRFLYVFAMQMQGVMLGWQMYILTESPFFLGLIGLAEAIPALGFALYAGYYLDHHRPLPVLYKFLLLNAFSATLMFFCQSEATGLSLHLKIAALFLSSFITGGVRAFAHPTIYTLVPSIVPAELLPKAAATSASANQTARIIGPAAGGILFGIFGISHTSIIVFLLLITAALLTMRIAPTKEVSTISNDQESIGKKLLLGFNFVWKHPILFPAMTLDMVSVFLGGVTALLPIYVSKILHADSSELGLLRACPSIGAALIAAVLVRVSIGRNAGKIMYASVVGFGLSICIFALSTNLWLSMFALAASGLFDSISVVIRTSAIQLCSPAAIRGRISSVNSIFVSSSNELGEMESGLLAGWIGAMPAALFGGLACIGTALIMYNRFASLRDLDLGTLRE